ncbi:MAG TPA: AraC family transcriptional regulator [Gemmatimonadaceae bacterium]|jgi:AraC family transcriptional regulator|nr:AraC family transcriptional regulator [Gemmatimonadaceae bacterium]
MKSETRSTYAQAVGRVLAHIAAHLDEALDLESLARGACLSPFHFHRVFGGMVGETPMELVRRLRMERAAWRLAHTTASVTNIAFGAGYETHEAFTRAFRACYNLPPSEFRRRQLTRIELSASNGIHFDDENAAAALAAFTPRNTGGLTMQVELKNKPALRAAGVRHIGPYMQINEAFGRLGAIAGPAGLFAQPGAAMIAIYHDDPESTPVDQLRSDAAIVVPDGIAIPPFLTEHRLPARRYACTVYTGPYERLGDVWQRFMGEWIPANGLRIVDGESYELYLNDPSRTPKEELKTEICVPVA